MSKFFRRVLPTALATLLLAGTLSAHAAEVKGVLTDAKLPADATYNGIVVPEGAFTVDPNNGDPVTAPYLVSKDQGGYAPDLINIDRGRQLFIDDFLIEETNLNRTFYSAIHAIIEIIRYRTWGSPVMSTAKIVSLSAALVSMLNLETAMFAQFGADMAVEHQRIFIILTGAGISVTVVTFCVILIVKANKEIRREKDGT